MFGNLFGGLVSGIFGGGGNLASGIGNFIGGGIGDFLQGSMGGRIDAGQAREMIEGTRNQRLTDYQIFGNEALRQSGRQNEQNLGFASRYGEMGLGFDRRRGEMQLGFASRFGQQQHQQALERSAAEWDLSTEHQRNQFEWQNQQYRAMGLTPQEMVGALSPGGGYGGTAGGGGIGGGSTTFGNVQSQQVQAQQAQQARQETAQMALQEKQFMTQAQTQLGVAALQAKTQVEVARIQQSTQMQGQADQRGFHIQKQALNQYIAENRVSIDKERLQWEKFSGTVNLTQAQKRMDAELPLKDKKWILHMTMLKMGVSNVIASGIVAQLKHRGFDILDPASSTETPLKILTDALGLGEAADGKATITVPEKEKGLIENAYDIMRDFLTGQFK